MAAQILFKMTCPSCEAPVPIRDESRIGKKIECPKCKFRFVVEDPGDESGGGAAPAKTKPAKKKSNATLLIGGGVGTVAVLVLAVVAYFMFSGGDDAAKKPITKTAPLVSNTAAKPESTPATNTAEPVKTEEKSGDTPKTDVAATPTVQSEQPIPAANASGEITNLLPNESVSVAVINMDKFRFSTLGEQLFESKVGFRPGTFKEKLGIAIEDMVKFVRGENPEQKWSFNIIRTAKPVSIKELETVLQFKKGAKSPIKGRAYYELPQNDLLDNLGTALKSESELRKDPDKKEEPAGPLGLVVLDQTTVIIATIDPLEQFLNDNAKPLLKSKPAKGADGEAAPPASESPAKPRGGRGMTVNYSTTMLQPGAGDDDPGLVANATFLTIDPELKAMFDRLERDLKAPPILMAAAKVQADPSIVARIRSLPGLNVLSGRGMRVFGLILTKYELEKFYATVAIEFFNENDVKELEAQLKKILPNLGQLLGAYLGGIKVETEGGDAAVAGGGGGGRGGGGRGGPPGGEQQTPGGNEPEGPASKLKLSRKARYLILEGEMNLVQRAYDRIYSMTEATVAKMRGMVEMASPTPLWKEWSAGLVKLYEENGGTIPRGTYQLKEGTGGRMARNWPPSHRVSWMAAVLPQLGKDELFRQIQRDQPWREERNLKAGSVLVPEFLDPRYPDRTWYAHLDTLGSRVVAATHYVGISGIGLEAGDYKADDPALAKKLGAFGYERTTSIKDVTDGLANTIFVIEVPPNHQRPWIAGGGSTVMGVPEQKSFRPFVNKHKDKRGAFVVMLDGSVRFIAEGISDDVFKALCTIKGGEAIEDLEKIAPKAKPGTAEMKTTAKAE
jgi:Protein of unknown function (DUF1559)